MPSPAFKFLKVDEIVRAGAGAGKTYTLTHKVMELAETYFNETQSFPSLIVTTFTRKATQELRERLMLLALEEKPHLLDFVNSSHLFISTLHGVMDLFLKRYGARVGLDPGFELMSDMEASKLKRQILKTILFSKEPYGDLLQVFTFSQILAMTENVVLLKLEHGESHPFQSQDAFKLFKEQASDLRFRLIDVANRIQAESVKSDWLAMANVFKEVAELLDQTTDDWEAWSNQRQTLLNLIASIKTARRNAKAPPVSDETADLAQVIREDLKDLNSEMYQPEFWVLGENYFNLVNQLSIEFCDAFKVEKRRRGQLELSDLELLAMECLRADSDAAAAFSREWNYWLIDEYQDTSPFQVELLKPLVGESPSFIVGDPQQSIYLFRGARSEVFLNKELEIQSHEGKIRRLSVNRRSQPELLLFFNDVFEQIGNQFQPMVPFFGNGDGELSEQDAHLKDEKVVAHFLVASNPKKGSENERSDKKDLETGQIPSSASTELKLEGNVDDSANESEEGLSLVGYIQKLLNNGAAPESICVLGRTNQALAEVARRLNDFGVPTHLHAASGFYDRREIQDALALLKFLLNPHDNFNAIELFRSPWFCIPDQALIDLARNRPVSLWTELQKEHSFSDEMNSVQRLLHLIRRVKEVGVAETWREALIQSGFIDLSHFHDVSGRREANLWKLMVQLEQEERLTGFNPLQFIRNRLSEWNRDLKNSEGDAVAAVEPARVNLMTVHASKGLEFAHVILSDMGKRPRVSTFQDFTFDENLRQWAFRIPFGENLDRTGSLLEKNWLKQFREQELAEHARVLYVALTRASESVYLSWTEPVQEGSWAQLLKFKLNQGTNCVTGKYSYHVFDKPLVPSRIEKGHFTHLSLRSPWQKRMGDEKSSEIIDADPSSKRTLAKNVSVSDILNQSTGVQYRARTRDDFKQSLTATNFGTAVHRLLEISKYAPMEQIDELIPKWFPGQRDEIFEALQYLRELSKPAVFEIMERGEVEFGFSFLNDGFMIEGQIDLWGRDQSGQLWIIDYKTGSVYYREKAFAQLRIYAKALSMSGLSSKEEVINLAALYPFERKCFVDQFTWSEA